MLAASHASTELDFTSLEEAALRMEEHAEEPRCLFVSHDANVSAIVSRLRQRASLLTVPVIAVVPHPSESFFLAAFASGADDALVSGDRGGITRRLANLLSAAPAAKRTGPRQGLALVASGDIGMRRMLSQTLRRAGFDVSYATEARELVELAKSAQGLSLVVATSGFAQGAEAAIAAARAASQKKDLPALVVPEDADETWRPTSDLKLGASGKLLSFAEEVVRRDATDQRASARLPYSTICAFRPAGVMQPTYGLTHNVSREGLFIRTLDPPRPGSAVWIELRAPESPHVVHLRGDAVWRREPGAIGATPFGFGMRTKAAECPGNDNSQYTAGYATACEHAESEPN
jgi:DNA-binding response OmpR family regulator